MFTTSFGTPYEPRKFARHFALRCSKASVRYIRVHDTRRTCASLWWRWTCIRGWPCRSCDIRRSTSRWPSTARFHRPLPARRLSAWAGNSMVSVAVLHCCTEIDKAGPLTGNRPLAWVGDTGIEPVTSSV